MKKGNFIVPALVAGLLVGSLSLRADEEKAAQPEGQQPAAMENEQKPEAAASGVKRHKAPHHRKAKSVESSKEKKAE